MSKYAYVVLAALLVLVGFVVGVKYDRAQWNVAKVDQQAVVVQKQADVISTNQARTEKANKVDSHAQEQTRILAVSVDLTAAERDGLLDQLAAVRADALSAATTRARLAAEASAAADGLGECSSRYSTLAGERDELAIQVGGLLDLLPEMTPEAGLMPL